jgi:phosphoglycolate phosphatase
VATLFFDLDGTLVDSSPGITRCATHALVALDVPVPAHEELLTWIGPPLRESFAPHVGIARVEDAMGLYRERYEQVGWLEHEAYSGLGRVVEALHARGHRLIVVTAKNETHARRIVAHLPHGRCFEDVVGASADGRLAHKRDIVAEALRRHGLEPADCVMVGDRRMDMEGAVVHGLRGVGVLWGFGSEEELRTAGADALALEPADLLRLLD